MNAENLAKLETRPLGAYIKAKLGIKLSEFCIAEDVVRGTINGQWTGSIKQKVRVMDSVHRFYIKRFDEL